MTTVYVNCHDGANAAADTNRTWNDMSALSGAGPQNMLDKDGVATGWDLEVQDTWHGRNSSNTEEVGSGDAAWVDEGVIKKSYIFCSQAGDAQGAFRIEGLANSTTYYVEVFGSRDTLSTGRLGDYGSTTSPSDVTNYDSFDNLTAVAAFSQTSSVVGHAFIYVAATQTDDFAYINAFRISDSADFDESGSILPLQNFYYYG